MSASKLKKVITKIIKFWLPVLVCMGIIFYSSSIHGQDIPALFPLQDEAYHILVYLILAFLFSRALKNSYKDATPFKLIFFTMFFCILYALTDEMHQALVPYRSVSSLDLFIDSVGSFIGALIYRWLR